MKNKKSKLVALSVTVLGLSLGGCASPAMYENMIVNGTQFIKMEPSQKFYHSVKNVEVTGGKDTNPLWTSQVGSEDFQIALNKSLVQAGILSEVGPYDMKAHLVSLKQPIIGFSYTVRATVDYLIKDRQTGQILLDEKIESAYTASMSESPIGIIRLRLANEGAIRNNIESLLQKLNHGKNEK